MRCPICKNVDTKVIDTRASQDGMGIRRRRECERCNERFSTNEEMELLDITVVKRDNSREAYQSDKIEQGLRLALRKRPYTTDSFRTLMHRIERDIAKTRKREITTRELGDIVMHHLKNFDTIGYIRFASIYRQFADVATFAKELQHLQKPVSRRKRKK